MPSSGRFLAIGTFSPSRCPTGSTSSPPPTPSATGAAAPSGSATRWAPASVSASPSTTRGSSRPWGSGEARRAEDERRAQELEREGVDLFLDRWRAQRLFETLPREAAMLDDRRRGNTVQRLAHQLRVLGPGAQEPLWDRLAELAMPVLLVA